MQIAGDHGEQRAWQSAPLSAGERHREGAPASLLAWTKQSRKLPSSRSSWSPDATGAELRLVGGKGCTDAPKIIEIYKIEIDPMITHVTGLEEISTAFDLMSGGKSISFIDRPLGKSEK